MTTYNCQGDKCDTRAALSVLSEGQETITPIECVEAMRVFDEQFGDTHEMQDTFNGVPCGTAILALRKVLETK